MEDGAQTNVQTCSSVMIREGIQIFDILIINARIKPLSIEA
jgi:hypothetical protein